MLCDSQKTFFRSIDKFFDNIPAKETINTQITVKDHDDVSDMLSRTYTIESEGSKTYDLISLFNKMLDKYIDIYSNEKNVNVVIKIVSNNYDKIFELMEQNVCELFEQSSQAKRIADLNS